jgi:hypothetical protein
VIFERLRDAGLIVESHHVRFRHNTEDEAWLGVVGEKKWVVLTRDQMIGRRLLELDALLAAGVKAFVLVTHGLTDSENAKIIIDSIPKILGMVAQNRFPFIAKIRQDDVVLWKTEPMIGKGVHRKSAKKRM